jgi:DNA-binding response OmpR family regulator
VNVPLHVLIVEDSLSQQQLFTQFLKLDVLITVEVVRTCKEAVEEIKHRKYDVVLLDLTLPDAHNLEAIVNVRSATPHIPIVVLTGLGEHMERAVIHAGADDFICKPPQNAGVLIDAVRHAAIRRQVEAEFAGVHQSRADTAEAIKKFDELDREHSEN